MTANHSLLPCSSVCSGSSRDESRDDVVMREMRHSSDDERGRRGCSSLEERDSKARPFMKMSRFTTAENSALIAH